MNSTKLQEAEFASPTTRRLYYIYIYNINIYIYIYVLSKRTLSQVTDVSYNSFRLARVMNMSVAWSGAG